VIQVSIDFPGGPLATEVMPILQKIVQKKPLVVTGPVTREELAALERLEPQGRLCMLVEIVQGT
jgi:hypothetical protein